MDPLEQQAESAERAYFRQTITAELGEMVDGFINSPLGKYLMEEATKIEQKNLQKLKSIDPEDTKGVAKCQQNIKECTQALRWLLNKMAEGKQVLKNREGQETLKGETENG